MGESRETAPQSRARFGGWVLVYGISYQMAWVYGGSFAARHLFRDVDASRTDSVGGLAERL